MGLSDVLVGVGAALMGVGFYFLMGWPGVAVWCGFLLVAIGVAEARRKV